MRFPARALLTVALPAAGALALPAVAHGQYAAYALADGPGGTQQLVRFDPTAPGRVVRLGVTGAALTGIDFRPATGQLVGYDGSALYTLDRMTGAASLLHPLTSTTSDDVGFDFNPTVDRIRVVSASGTNLRLNPTDGGSLTDLPYAYAAGDAAEGQTPSFMAVAYTNSDDDPATGTALFGVDRNLGTLVRITTPNGGAGAVSTVGSLGLGMMPGVVGFDIVTVGATNVAFLTTSGIDAGASRLYTVDLATGATTLLGPVGARAGLAGISGLAVTTTPEPGTWALLGSGLLALGATARARRRGEAPRPDARG